MTDSLLTLKSEAGLARFEMELLDPIGEELVDFFLDQEEGDELSDSMSDPHTPFNDFGDYGDS
jgi:hypothetical protein